MDGADGHSAMHACFIPLETARLQMVKTMRFMLRLFYCDKKKIEEK